MIQLQFDLLLAHLAPQVDDIVGAKQEYFAQTGGEVHEDDRCFESRLQAFFNWYLFDRRLDGVTPAQSFLLEPKKGQVRVRDAVTRKVFDVTERRQMHGLEIGDLFEARLVPVGGTWHFSTSFTYHPREMTPVIVREIKKRKKQGPVDVRALVWELERMSLQADRFKNVSIEAIYNFESPFLAARKSAHG